MRRRLPLQMVRAKTREHHQPDPSHSLISGLRLLYYSYIDIFLLTCGCPVMLLSGIRPDKCDQSSVLDGSASGSADADTVPSRDAFFPALAGSTS